jgi:hypothetical protein
MMVNGKGDLIQIFENDKGQIIERGSIIPLSYNIEREVIDIRILPINATSCFIVVLFPHAVLFIRQNYDKLSHGTKTIPKALVLPENKPKGWFMHLFPAK